MGPIEVQVLEKLENANNIHFVGTQKVQNFSKILLSFSKSVQPSTYTAYPICLSVCIHILSYVQGERYAVFAIIPEKLSIKNFMTMVE